MKSIARAFGLLVLCIAAHEGDSGAVARGEEERIRLLIVDGQNNHDWRGTTPHLKSILEGCGKFVVEIATTPPTGSHDMTNFRPDFQRFDAILLNYNGDPWPEETHKALEAAVESGKGLIVVHAANNSFPGRLTYDRMLGLAWRPKELGTRIAIDPQGQPVRVEAGQGPNSGHGKRRPFAITVRQPDHPITKGMPTTWMHARDELYNGLRGPVEEMELLATAFDDSAQGGSGLHEPITWVVAFGKGRVFHTCLGHDVQAMRCVGFITLLQRGSEWAATGAVTIPIPEDFPTADKESTRGGWWTALAARLSKVTAHFWPFLLIVVLFAALWIRVRIKRRGTTIKPTRTT